MRSPLSKTYLNKTSNKSPLLRHFLQRNIQIKREPNFIKSSNLVKAPSSLLKRGSDWQFCHFVRTLCLKPRGSLHDPRLSSSGLEGLLICIFGCDFLLLYSKGQCSSRELYFHEPECLHPVLSVQDG